MSKKRKNRFFLNDHLHKVIHKNRALNQITAYDFVDCKVKVYPKSEVERMKQNAFSVREASEMLNRSKKLILALVIDGTLGYAQREHSMKTKKPGMYFFSEDGMMSARDYFASVHRGRPRKDGRITSYMVPTREEMRAMTESGRILYVKENNEFVPVWRAQDW